VPVDHLADLHGRGQRAAAQAGHLLNSEPALRVRVLEPLDLEQTWLHRWEEPRGEVGATGYLSSLEFWPTSTMFGELGATTSLDSSNLGYGHSGLVSTLEDGLKLVSALMKGEVLETESMEAMQTFVPIKEAAPDKPSPGYGLGLFHVIRPGYDMTGHGGMFNGHTAGFWYLPGCETSVAMYANRGFIDEFPIYDRLVDDLGCAVE